MRDITVKCELRMPGTAPKFQDMAIHFDGRVFHALTAVTEAVLEKLERSGRKNGWGTWYYADKTLGLCLLDNHPHYACRLKERKQAGSTSNKGSPKKRQKKPANVRKGTKQELAVAESDWGEEYSPSSTPGPADDALNVRRFKRKAQTSAASDVPLKRGANDIFSLDLELQRMPARQPFPGAEEAMVWSGKTSSSSALSFAEAFLSMPQTATPRSMISFGDTWLNGLSSFPADELA
eukprot:TRINITY_DN7944_c0_g2_i2.p1 TRINITY_DN7944_c0_g2~~TRINITY_DN7944_c0_g2_i2.p1  ORF type:complete len:236 (+),score=25.27 TRINITY_DN7944_c0_g2_i2:376-1083(+)